MLAYTLSDRVGMSLDFYSDNVGVYIISPVYKLSKTLSKHWGLVTSFRIDAITAASIRNGSGNGYNAVVADALTGASGRAGFEDVRIAPTLGMVYEKENVSVSFGRYLSNEIDYDVSSNYLTMKYAMNKANTVISYGVSNSYEGWNPSISRNLAVSTKETQEQKWSITQLVTPKSYVQIRHSSSSSEGFLSSPYHYLDGGTFVRYDAYPGVRESEALAFLFVQQFGDTFAVHGSYRQGSDSWQMESETAELKLFYDLFDNTVIGLKARSYTQTNAYFTKKIDDYTQSDTYIATDYRLRALGTTTFGFSVSYKPESLEDKNFVFNSSFNYFSTDKNNYIESWYGTPQIRAFYMTFGIGYDY